MKTYTELKDKVTDPKLTDEARQKLVFEWVKTGVITFSQFQTLLVVLREFGYL